MLWFCYEPIPHLLVVFPLPSYYYHLSIETTGNFVPHMLLPLPAFPFAGDCSHIRFHCMLGPPWDPYYARTFPTTLCGLDFTPTPRFTAHHTHPTYAFTLDGCSLLNFTVTHTAVTHLLLHIPSKPTTILLPFAEVGGLHHCTTIYFWDWMDGVDPCYAMHPGVPYLPGCPTPLPPHLGGDANIDIVGLNGYLCLVVIDCLACLPAPRLLWCAYLPTFYFPCLPCIPYMTVTVPLLFHSQ